MVPDERDLEETASRTDVEQADVGQTLERQPNRRARHPQPCHQRQLGDSLAALEIAAQQQFAYADERTGRLRCDVRGAMRDRQVARSGIGLSFHGWAESSYHSVEMSTTAIVQSPSFP